jgi:methylmalonyl-CoA/ethylmalonyl-CoA epimerase
MTIDHIAIAVSSVDAAADRFCALLGYARKTEKVVNTRQKVIVIFLAKAHSIDIKLIEPSEADSPLWAFVRKGGGLHHVCFAVPDVAKACDELSANGARVIAAPAPGEAFDDHLIAFCYLGFGLNAEVIDTTVRRSLLAEPGQ